MALIQARALASDACGSVHRLHQLHMPTEHDRVGAGTLTACKQTLTRADQCKEMRCAIPWQAMLVTC